MDNVKYINSLGQLSQDLHIWKTLISWKLLLGIGFIGILSAIWSHIIPKYTNLRNRDTNLKEIPVVEGGLPFIGHGISFSKDIIGFVDSCYKKYGKIFRIKIFRINMVVICDRELVNEFFKSAEDKLSLYDVLTRLYFADAFSDFPDTLPRIINLVKKSIAVKYDIFVPKIQSEAERMIERLKLQAQANSEIDLVREITRFVASISSHCFISKEITDELFEILMEFTNLLNKVVVATYFFPKWLIRLVINWKLTNLRKKITNYFDSEIESYRKDPDKNDSLVVRTAIDYIEPETGNQLSNQEIGDIIVCLLYVSSENTALGLTNTLTDIGCNQGKIDLKNVVKTYLNEENSKLDIKGLLADPVLNAAVMESARLNSHIFALNRRPTSKSMTIGNYMIPAGIQSVALCEPMLMVYGAGNEAFANPTQYNPQRFLGPKKEPMSPNQIMTWGAGIHLCPGKMFAIYEIKIAIALILLNFKFELAEGNLPQLDYFSPSAFAERKVKACLKPIQKQPSISITESTHIPCKSFNIDNITITRYSEGGWLIRDYMNRETQIQLYKYIFELSEDSSEHKLIKSVPLNKVFPFAYHNLVYTGKSNCKSEPILWYDWAFKLWNFLLSNKEILRFNGPDPKDGFNSLYAQLFGSGGSMRLHKDEYVNWGISINMGASTTFRFGENSIILHSGDIFVADFSKVEHGVEEIHDYVPDWFMKHDDDELDGVETFGRTRCSIQIRDISNIQPVNHITSEEFYEMLK